MVGCESGMVMRWIWILIHGWSVTPQLKPSATKCSLLV